MIKEKVKPCTELSEKVLNEMYSVGYSPKSVNHHVRPIYNRLARYCEELAIYYLKSFGSISNSSQ